MRHDVGDVVKCVMPHHPVNGKIGKIISVVNVRDRTLYGVKFYDIETQFMFDESELVVISHSVPKQPESKPKTYLDQLRADSPEDVPERDDVAPDLCVRDEYGVPGGCPRYETGEQMSCLDCWNRNMPMTNREWLNSLAKYIDAEKLIEQLKENHGNRSEHLKIYALSKILNEIAIQPAADVQEVKRAKWIYKGHHEMMGYAFECSIC